MFILHIALGGCLTPEPVPYGITEDSGGHIAYVLGAAMAQQALGDVDQVEIHTRLFREPSLPTRVAAECATTLRQLTPKLAIRRFASATPGYLSKEALRDEVAQIGAGIERHLERLARRPDVVHAHFADAAAIGLALRDRFGIPLIYTPHSLGADKPSHSGDPASRRRLVDERRALARADAIVVSSRDEGERQVGLYPGAALGRVRQIRPGCDTFPGNPADAQPLLASLADPDRPLILSIARPVAKKNLPALARAYAASPALQKQANLLILAGQRERPDWGCPEQRAELQALRAALSGRAGVATLPDTHSRAEVRALYAHAARVGGIFVNPALVEPFGLTTLEAAAAGLPCIVPLRGGAAEIVATLGHGIAVDATCPGNLERAMLTMLDQRHNAVAAMAARSAAHTLGWDRYAQATLDLIRSMRSPRRSAPSVQPAPERRLLVSDIDGTLTGDAASARRFAAMLAEDPSLSFVVATGRSISEAWRVLDEWKLPQPEALITSAGSEIYRVRPGGRLALDRDYARSLSGWHPERIAMALNSLPALQLQSRIEQRPWKLGYVGAAERAGDIRRRLGECDLAATVIHSHCTMIDVMPAQADKRAAVSYLAKTMEFAAENVIVAGDSGNDLAMLAGAWNGIVVGHDPDLSSLQSGPMLYRAKAPHAAGVLEGLSHYAAKRRARAA